MEADESCTVVESQLGSNQLNQTRIRTSEEVVRHRYRFLYEAVTHILHVPQSIISLLWKFNTCFNPLWQDIV